MGAKVSVIIPCYNQGKFLHESAGSVIAQTYSNWECIIVNDGSEDDTEKIAFELVKLDKRFIYLSKQNGGLSSARNAGLAHATGDWIQFLDADDALHPEKIDKHLGLIAKRGLSKEDIIVSYSQCYYSEYGDIYKFLPASNNYYSLSGDPLKEIVINWENKISIAAHSFFFSANIFSKRGIRFDEQIKTCEDIDCWIRIFQLRPNILFIEDKLAYYRNTPNSMSKNIDKVWKGHVQVMEKHIGLSGKKTELYKWARYKKNEVLFRYKKFGKMDFIYKLHFAKGILSYYKTRLFLKLHTNK